MFEEYDRTVASLRSVVDLFNREGILTARGCKWSMSTVRAILVNRKYTGDYVRFKVRRGKYHAIQDGEIVARRKGDGREVEAEPVVVEDHHAAIVPRKLFDRVQRKLKGQQKRTAHRTGHQYAFTGLLRCGDCGGPLGGAVARSSAGQRKIAFVYHCRRFHSQGRSACHCNSVGEAPLLTTVVRKMQAEVFSEKAIDRLLTAYRKRLAARRRVVPADDGGRLQRRIGDLDRQIDQGVKRVLTAPEAVVGMVYAEIEKLRQERDRLQADLAASGKPVAGTTATDDAKVEEAARVLRDLREAFTDATPEEVRDLLTPLVPKIELHFEHVQDGKKERNSFQYGTIFVRPIDPVLSLLFATPSRTRPHRPRSGATS